MIGDRLLIYNESSGKFFRGWRTGLGPLICASPKAMWTRHSDRALKSTNLRCMQQYVAMLNDGSRIVSETRAGQIDALRQYKEATEIV